MFVAVGGGTIMTSSNGADWTIQPSQPAENFGRVKFINGEFFAFGSSTYVSSDGASWTPLDIPSTPSDITFLNGKYYAIGKYGGLSQAGIATSTNRINWDSAAGPLFFTITAGGGTLVASSGAALNVAFTYSNDGQHWQNVAGFPTLLFAPELTYQNGLFFGIRFDLFPFPSPIGNLPVNSLILSYSSDGQNWQNGFALQSQPPGRGPFTPRKIAAGGGYYVFPAGNSLYYTTNLIAITSGDAANWTRVDLNIASAEGTLSDLAFGNNTFVAVTLGKIFKSLPITGSERLRIVKEPADTSVNVGGTVVLTVSVQGSDPISYQWRKNQTNLLGKTSSTLTLTDVSFDAAASYDVRITNPAGSVFSRAAIVSVNFADILLYPGVTLRGQIGDRFSIESQDTLTPNAPWENRTNLTLASPLFIWIDYTAPGLSDRFYRATFQGR